MTIKASARSVHAKLTFLAAAAVMLVGCESVEMTQETVKGMPSGFLCEALGPNWITTVDERVAIYAELESRRVECMPASRVVVENR